MGDEFQFDETHVLRSPRGETRPPQNAMQTLTTGAIRVRDTIDVFYP